MKNRWFKSLCSLCLVLLLTLGAFGVLGTPVSAAETNDTFFLTYTGLAWQVSPHWATVTHPTGDEGFYDARTHETTAYLYGLFPDPYDFDEFYLAYCCDLATGQRWDYPVYRIVNIEDVSYYTPEQARMLRTIIENGYWADWEYRTDDPAGQLAEAAGIRYLEDEDGNVIDNGILLPSEAMSATQLAIWLYGNSDKENVYVSGIYSSSYVASAYLYAPNEVNFANEVDPELNQYTEAHIKAVLDYLVELAERAPMERKAGQTILTDRFSVDWVHVSAKKIDSGARNFSFLRAAAPEFEITLSFSLQGDNDNYKNVCLNATYGDETVASNVPLAGTSSLLSYDSDNNKYTLTFKTDRLERVVGVELTGEQEIDAGSYVFMSENGGTSSQNFIGKAEQRTVVPINARFYAGLDLSEIELTKINDDNKPVSGCVFELWEEKDGFTFLHGTYVTDDDGKITLDQMLDASWRYYFKEISAPEGYLFDDSELDIPDDGKLEVVNHYKTGSLNIKKEVSGLITDQGFAFTLELDLSSCLQDAAEHLTSTFAPDEKVTSWDVDNGIMTVNIVLKDGESYKLAEIPVGAVYTVTELGGKNLEYAGELEYASGLSYLPNKESDSGIVEGDVEIVFINALDAEEPPPVSEDDNSPPTGDTFSVFWVIAVVAVCVVLLIFIFRRRNHE